MIACTLIDLRTVTAVGRACHSVYRYKTSEQGRTQLKNEPASHIEKENRNELCLSLQGPRAETYLCMIQWAREMCLRVLPVSFERQAGTLLKGIWGLICDLSEYIPRWNQSSYLEWIWRNHPVHSNYNSIEKEPTLAASKRCKNQGAAALACLLISTIHRQCEDRVLR